jgi:RNA 3'-terminal phosphate cyclase
LPYLRFSVNPLPSTLSGPRERIAAFGLNVMAESEKMIGDFSSLGERGKRAEEAASEAVDSWVGYIRSGASVDLHLADHLLVFMAPAKRESSFTTERITRHLITNLWVIRQFERLRVSLSGELGNKGRVDLSPVRVETLVSFLD